MRAARPCLEALVQLLPLASAFLAVPTGTPRDEEGRQVGACIVHLQQRWLAASGQVTVVTGPGRLWELRGLSAPRRLLLAEDVQTRGLPTYNYVTDLFVVDQLGVGMEATAAVLDALPQYSRTAIVLVAEAGHSDAAVAALWRHNFVNAVVLAAGAAGVEAFSFRAFSRCDEAPRAELVGSCTAAGGWRVSAPLLPRNARLRLGGCTLVCDTAESPSAVLLDGNDTSTAKGVVIAMLQEFGRRMVFKPRLQAATDGLLWGWAYENGTGTGMLGDVMARRAHVAVGGFLPLHNRDVVLDLTRSAEFMCMTWVVPTLLGS